MRDRRGQLRCSRDLSGVRKARLRMLERFLGGLAFRDIFDNGHNISRGSVCPGEQRNIVSDPDQTSVFAATLLLNVKLFAPAIEKLCHKGDIERLKVRRNDIKVGFLSQFIFGEPDHPLICGVRHYEAAFEVYDNYTNS